MNRKLLLSATCAGLAGLSAAWIAGQRDGSIAAAIAPDPLLAGIETAAGDSAPAWNDFTPTGFAGDFLSSHFAQERYDWKTANEYLGRLLDRDPGNRDLVKRSMVLAMGYGDLDLAARRADQLLALEKDNSLALLFRTVQALSKDDTSAAAQNIALMPDGDMTDFIKPILKGWVQAGMKSGLQQQGTAPPFGETTTIHAYHAGLISVFLGDKKGAARAAGAISSIQGLNGMEAERAADLFACAGEKDRALALYRSLGENVPPRVGEKVAALESGAGPEKLAALLPPLKIKTRAQGAAQAMFDMAYLLYQEGSDNSAKLFANMSLALDPALTEARILLSDTLVRGGRFEDAIDQLKAVPPDHAAYMESQRHAAELLAEAGRMDDALALLNRLFTERNDVESLIRIGDLYRTEENYSSALTAYNKAAAQIGRDIPEEYWHLLYARGMAYEREGDWARAESDLKAALTYRPNHPYLLNYLGYGWADQGQNLEESLALIKKAVSLRPGDGYIVDSLGWVQFMMGRYDDAIASLEKAVQLQPYDATINDHLGDAYWRVGRRSEARFQWERALNGDTDDKQKRDLEAKLQGGLPDGAPPSTRHASSTASGAVE